MRETPHPAIPAFDATTKKGVNMKSKFSAITSLIVIFGLAFAFIIFYTSREPEEITEFDPEQLVSEHIIIASTQAPRLIFPRRNTIISDSFETFPLILQPDLFALFFRELQSDPATHGAL